MTNNLWDAPAEAASITVIVDGRSSTVDLMPSSALPEGAIMGPDGTVSIGKPNTDLSG